jgi:hypothetical protein
MGEPGRAWASLGEPGRTWANLGEPGRTWANLGEQVASVDRPSDEADDPGDLRSESLQACLLVLLDYEEFI